MAESWLHFSEWFQGSILLGENKISWVSVPGGHLKIPHLWPGQNPPVEGTGFSVFTL